MFDVFAMRHVRAISELPVVGSSSSGKSSMTSVISLPPLAAADVDDDVRVGVLGGLVLSDRLAGAEGAGIAAVLPFDGEQAVEDALARHERRGRGLLLLGRALFADRPPWRIRISSPESSSTTVSSTVKLPDSIETTSPPSEPGGTITLWSILGVSGTVPTMSPVSTTSPSATSGSNSQVFSGRYPGRRRRGPGTATPSSPRGRRADAGRRRRWRRACPARGPRRGATRSLRPVRPEPRRRSPRTPGWW